MGAKQMIAENQSLRRPKGAAGDIPLAEVRQISGSGGG